MYFAVPENVAAGLIEGRIFLPLDLSYDVVIKVRQLVYENVPG